VKHLIFIVLTSICSGAVMAGPQVAADSPSTRAARAFDCGPELRAEVTLRAVGSAEAQSEAYTAVAAMQTNGRAADPLTLRFVNEKIAGRTIETLTKTCQKGAMDLVFSIGTKNGEATDTLTVTVRGTTVTVR